MTEVEHYDQTVTLLTTTDRSTLVFVDPTTTGVTREVPLGEVIEGLALSPDATYFLAGLVASDFSHSLAMFDAETGNTRWRMPLSELSGIASPRVSLIRADVLAFSPQAKRAYVWPAAQGETIGLAAFDPHMKVVTGFDGPWQVAAGGIVPLPSSAAHPTGLLAIIASRANRQSGPRLNEAVYLIEPISLIAVDSVTPQVLFGEPGEDIWQVVPGPTPSRIYVAGSRHIVQYDLESRAAIHGIPREANGQLLITPDMTTLVLSDSGTWPDSPGSGLLYVYDRDLNELGQIDVSSPIGGHPLSVLATRVTTAVPDAGLPIVYLRTGTETTGPLYPPQPARILTVDLESMVVSDVVQLNSYGGGRLFLIPGG